MQMNYWTQFLVFKMYFNRIANVPSQYEKKMYSNSILKNELRIHCHQLQQKIIKVEKIKRQAYLSEL